MNSNSSAAAIFLLEERNARVDSVLASRQREPSRHIAHDLAHEPAETAALLGRGKGSGPGVDSLTPSSSLVGKEKL